MYEIKLTGELDWELTRIGFKPGDIVHATINADGTGAMYFDKMYCGTTYQCVVWADNYEILKVPYKPE